ELRRHEVPRDVEVAAPPGKARRVVDRDGGNRPLDTPDASGSGDGTREAPSQRLHAVEHASRRGGPDRHALRGGFEAVAFGSERLAEARVLSKRDEVGSRRPAGADDEIES